MMQSEPAPIQRFVTEAREHLAVMTTATMSLERDDAQRQRAIEQLLRAAHSIKGGAGFIGRRKIEELAHALEESLESIRDSAAAPSDETVDTLLAVQDRILAMLDDIDHCEEMDIAELVARLQQNVKHAHEQSDSLLTIRSEHRTDSGAPLTDSSSLIAAALVTAEAFALSPTVLSQPHATDAWIYGIKLDWHECEDRLGLDPHAVCERIERAGSVLEARTEASGPPFDEALPHEPTWWLGIAASPLEPKAFAQQLAIAAAGIVVLRKPPTAQPKSASSQPQQERPTSTAPASSAASLRISVRLIDRLVELAGELSMVRNQTARATDPANAAMRQLMRRLDAVTNEVQDAALRMRMQPVGTLFDRFPRLVRDLARQLGKQIELEITGSEVALDKAILEMLVDPLTHLIRNCCDHGIELPEKRTAAGKSPTGTLRLSARQDRGQIVIEVRDDGRGIDADAVKRKALQQGVKRSDELDRLSDRQVFDLILLSGFSTAERVSDLSGRGVGMDVVKTNLDQIGGVVEIDSTPGRGTLFNLRLPLTLAIVPGLVLLSGGQQFVLPQRDVEEILLLDPASGRNRIECSHDEELLRLRGQLLPVIRLADVLDQRLPLDAQAQLRIIQRQRQNSAQAQPVMYAAVIRVGSHRFVLVFDQVVESESIVVKPLHPLLRPLTVYAGMAILSDGNVALILSSEGVARHSGILHRPAMEEAPAALSAASTELYEPALLFRHGPAELLAIPLREVRRVVMISLKQLQLLGDREVVDLDGTAVNVLRIDRFLNLSACLQQEWLFLILPRHPGAQIALLASEIVDSPMLPTRLDEQAFQVDGVAGCAMVRGQVALFLDAGRLVEMWRQIHGGTRALLPAPDRKRVLVVEDTQFFQKLITSSLIAEGYHVQLAGNGREGLDRLNVEPFDMIVSDLEMPVMNGFEFARQVRLNARHQAMPMLALTTLNTAENRAKAAQCGFDQYEVKFDRPSFLRSIYELLTRGRSTALIRGGAGHE